MGRGRTLSLDLCRSERTCTQRNVHSRGSERNSGPCAKRLPHLRGCCAASQSTTT
jgi:hypothetical protein